MSTPRTTDLGRRAVLAGVPAGLLGTVAAGCSIQIRSEPDPSIGDDTLLVAGDAGSPTFEKNFNPYLSTSRAATDYIYEPLIVINPLDGKLTPWLASDWEQPDPAILRMTLRKGATWHDGTPLTSEDVLFTFDLLKNNPATDLNGAWNRIREIAADEDVITFRLQTDDVPALSVIGNTLIVPEHIWTDVDDPGTWRNPDPIGSGPFQLGSFTPQQYALDRFAEHWQAENVQLGHIVLPAANKEEDLVTRGFDFGYSFISNVDETWGAANENNKYWFPPGGTIGLQPNFEVAPFDDVRVRRGLALALDKAKIAEVAVEGHMEPASQTGLLLPNHEDLLVDSIPHRGVVQPDREAAIESFQEAGFTYDGETMIDPAGEPFSFSILTANSYTDALRAVQEIRRQLSEIGIAVTITKPQAAAKEASQSKGDYEVAFGAAGGGDAYKGYNNLLSSEFYAPVGETTQNNRIRFQDEDVDELLDRYRSAVDEETQSEILRNLEEIFYEQLPIVALYYGALWGLYNDGRFVGWPSEEDPYAPLQTWGSSLLLIMTRLQPVGSGVDA
ncbi:MAG: ABC transporter substrate-binding protein [Brachybacterium sp.]|uniref:ABC transporter substrate-binding protein n=1 Tax=Brachybacterium sp. TaxID=1891286 RepID=UPI00264743B4|nr:ABC transporter substrate-binding protein [Brachybacterium sp.]MDN5685129.1 ABC transporter substrate-binding protein [Brachybacterium sp.]